MSFQRILALGLAMLMSLSGARAQTVWTGATSSSFTTPANWFGPFANDGTTDGTFSGTITTVPIVDANALLKSLTYASGTSSFTLANSSSATLTLQSSLAQNSANPQTITAPLTLGTTFTFSGPGGTQALLNVNGGLTAPGGFTASNGIYLKVGGAWSASAPVTLQGTGTVLEFAGAGGVLTNSFVNNASLVFNTGTNLTMVNGVISGAGSVTSSSPVVLTAANTYTGGTTINGGQLELSGSGSLASSGAVVVNAANGATNATFQVGNSATIGTLTFGGSGATANSTNQVMIGSTGNLLLQGDVAYNATNNPASAVINGNNLSLSGTRAFNIGDSSNTKTELLVFSSIVGGNVTKTGAGTLVLGGYNGFGDLTVAGGAVQLGFGMSAGTGTVTLQNGSALGAYYSQAILSNPVVLGNNVTLGGNGNYGDALLSFGGSTTLLNSVTTVHLAGDGVTRLASIDGPANTALTFDGGGRVALTAATSGNITSITADGAAVVFHSAGAVPSTLTVGGVNHGYIGVGGDPWSTAPISPFAVLNRITNKAAFDGTFGFDTDTFTAMGYETGTFSSMGPRVFTNAFDFSAFTHPNFTIGSSSIAVLTGPITPPSTGYVFGNGGGALILQSNLTAPRSVAVSSTSLNSGLLAVFRGNNTFTGNLSIANSAVVLDSAAALPAGRTVAMGGTASYLGATEAFKSATGFLSFAAGNVTLGSGAILGFDSHQAINQGLGASHDDNRRIGRTISDTIDLSGFGSVALGTVTSVDFTGSVVAPSHGVLTLLPMTEGSLTISSVLSSANVSSVVVGDATIGEHGVVELKGANTYSGGTTLKTGLLVASNNSALGSGTLTVSSTKMPALASGSAAGVTLANPIVLNSSLILGGANINSAEDYAAAQNKQLTLSGGISGTGGLFVTYGRTNLTGTNTYTGATTVEGGTLVFGNAGSIPANSQLAVGYSSYLGIAFNNFTSGLQTDFLNRIDRFASSGTIGFDTLSGSQLTFAGNINLADPDGTGPLASFNHDVRLGSSTTARLIGTITPAFSSVYNFGGGGGLLDIGSALVDDTAGPRSVNVNSVVGPLTLRLSSTANTYTGSTTSANSAVIFAAGARPAASTLSIGYAGYIGTEETSSTAVTSFLAAFPASQDSGVIGFDAVPGTTGYTINSNLDLSRFTSTWQELTLGTTTNLTFGTGASITLPASATAYRFAGYKGGTVQVDMTLADGAASGPRGVVVGSPDSSGTQSDSAGNLSVVRLNGTNTYTGGTTLYAGNLQVGSSQALGSGALQVRPNYFGGEVRPRLSATTSGLSLANAIVLSSELEVLVNSTLTLSGVISDGSEVSGELYKLGTGSLTLSGHNTFSGGIYIQEGAVTFTQADSVGTGPLGFGITTSSNPSATFLTSSTVNGIYGDSSLDQINLATGSTLTINQTFDSQYLGTFSGTNAALVFQNSNGSGVRLRLAGASTGFTGTATIGSGLAVVAVTNNVFGPASNAVTLNGGKLSLDTGVTFSNPLTLTAGKLGGVGTYQPTSAGGYAIQAGVALAPGLAGPGKLFVDGSLVGTAATLTLGDGGAYHWQITDATNTATGWDVVAVTGAVNITATPIGPFNFKLTTVASDGSLGIASNFDPYSTYAWPVLTATNITGFTGTNQFVIDTTSFLNGTAGGTFNLSLNPAGTSLMLNFVPVPEPSTWVLMIAGAFAVVRGLRRRRRS